MGAGALGDAAVCQCSLTQLEAETNGPKFEAAVTAWQENSDGAGFRSAVAQVIARCQGQQQTGSAPEVGVATAASPVARSRTVKIGKVAYAKRFRWPHNPQSMLHSCLDGTAVANGMSCGLAHAIDRAFGDYPETITPVVRYLRLVDPDNGRIVSVACAVSGHQNASAVCAAPEHQMALLPPAGYSD